MDINNPTLIIEAHGECIYLMLFESDNSFANFTVWPEFCICLIWSGFQSAYETQMGNLL